MWTRNYNNLLNSVMSRSSRGQIGASSHPFDDTYTGNFKNFLGGCYEICTYNPTWSSSTSFEPALCYARAGLVPYNQNNALSLLSSLNSIQGAVSRDVLDDNVGKIYVAFANGDVDDNDETYEDYRLGGTIIGSIIFNSVTTKVIRNDDGTYTISHKIILTATADFTIREMGIFLPIPYSSSDTSYSYGYYALINRIVLDEPISAEPDEVVHVNFSITTPKITISG